MLLITHVLTTLSTLSTLAIAAKSGSLINGLILNHRRDISPQIANASAVVGAGSHGYTYVGCYNETTGITGSGGARALVGAMEANTTTTTATCLSYCHAGGYDYAGLEYGQECWCSQYLSALSKPLNSSVCDLACVGNTSEICGGSLALTLYNLTGKSSGAVGGFGREGKSWGMVAGAAVIGVVVVGLM